MDFQIIHIVLGKANPERMNGVNKVVNSLASYQSVLEYSVTVWGITKNPVVNFPQRKYTTILFKDVSKFSMDKALQKTIEKTPQNTIFHIHGGFIPQFFAIARQLKKHQFDYLYTPHGAYNTVALQRSKWKKKVYIQLFEKYLAKNAKHLHSIGESEITGSEKVFGQLSHVLIPNGQNLEELQFEYLPIERKGSPVFGFVGRVDIHTKGLDLLVKGFAQYLSRKNQNAQLWIIGDGADAKSLVALTNNLSIQSHVHFWGSKYGAEKLNLMANMDYFCLTSRNEGLPGVVLEAAGLGIPSIVSKTTNMGHFIQSADAGICLSENTPSAIADALEIASTAISNDTHTQQKSNAKQMVVEQFDWKVIAKKMIEAYAA